MNTEGKKKSFGLWWKVILAGMVVSVLAVIVGVFAMSQPKAEAKIYVGFNTGEEKEFEMTGTGTMWLHETNSGLGSSPGRIEDAEKTVRVYGPDGGQLVMSEDRLEEVGSIHGTYTATIPGTYKLVADSVGKAESSGQLRGKRPYSLMRSVCDYAFFYALPAGLGLVVLGLLFGLIRGLGKMIGGRGEKREG